MDKKNSIKKLEILLNNALLLAGDIKAVNAYASDTGVILAIENVNLRRVAAEIYVLAQSIGGRKITIEQNRFRVSETDCLASKTCNNY